MKLALNDRAAYAYTGGKTLDTTLPCVVFVHGALNDHSVWTLLARYFAHHGRSVLAVDLPGHGRSEGPPLARVEDAADWLLALLAQAGVQRASFVGHSMGSLIALEAAARAPALAQQLVMVGTAYPMKVSEALLSTAREAPQRAMAMVNNFSHASWASKPSYPGPGSWLHGAGLALMRRTLAGGQAHFNEGGNLFVHDFEVCDRYARGLEAAAQVRCPAHLVLGDFDQMTSPKATRELATTLKAQVARVPAGHNLMGEAPDAVLKALKQALG
jgi:pimeloyl-ACP methyl ester carboxylesterase